MNFREHGFILFTTILILGSLILVVLAQMQVVIIFAKYLSHTKKANAVIYQLEKTARLLSRTCLRNALDPNLVITKLSEEGCHYKDDKYEYIYIVEDLGTYPCLKTKMHSLTFSTSHRRITLKILEKKPQILQLRLITAVKDEPCLLINPKFTAQGLVSWRQL